jgi:hypothetical protein
VVIQSEEGTITGNFSLYNPTDQQYSVLFEKEGEEEKCELKDLNLNRQIFQVYVDDPALGNTQNLRLKNAVTVLAVWDSIALQIPGDDFTVQGTGMYVASWWNPVSWIKKAVEVVFQALPVIALVAAVIICAPIAIAIVETILIEPIAIVMVSAFIAVPITVAVVNTIKTCPGGSPPSPPPSVPVSVTVTRLVNRFANNATLNNITLGPTKMSIGDPSTIPLNDYDSTVNNNPVPYDLMILGNTLTFELQFYGGYPVSETAPGVNLFDPVLSEYSTFSHIVTVAKEVNTTDRCTITVTKEREGYIEDGAVQAVIRFGYDMTINSSDAGVDFVNDTDTTVSQHRKDVFIININTKPQEGTEA